MVVLSKRRVGKVVTALVLRSEIGWAVRLEFSPGRLRDPASRGEGELVTDELTLDAAIDAANDQIAAGLETFGRAPVLVQYVIEPSQYEGRSEAVFHIERSSAGVRARDISREGGVYLSGRTFEQLIDEASILFGPRPEVSLRWTEELRSGRKSG